MVAFNGSIPLCFVAASPQRATKAILSLVFVDCLFKPILGFTFVASYFIHRLLHWTVVFICFRVVKQVIWMERIFSVLFISLLFVEVVVFHIGSHFFLF